MSADLELAAAVHVLRSRLVELVVNGDAEWTTLIDGNLVPVEMGYGLDADGAIIVSFVLVNAPGDEEFYHLHADGIHVRSEPGKITKGRNCRLRMSFPAADSGRLATI